MNEYESQVATELHEYGITYLSGYKAYNSMVRIRCEYCGYEWEMNRHNLTQKLRGHKKSKNDYIPCPECRQKLFDQRSANKRRAEDEERFIKKFRAWLKKNTIHNTIELSHVCKNCGKEYKTSYTASKYCSDRCRERAREARKRSKRNKDIQSRVHDEGITLDILFKKTKGVCYICGRRCDYNDFKMINGNIITGNRYPSIEHIIPIAKGGTDTWNNVKLAHRICNSTKGARIVEQMKIF